MPCHHQNKSDPGARRSARRPRLPVRHSDARGVHSASQRAQIVARLIAASQALPAHPDAAVLLLDGALNDMLALWARRARLQEYRGAAALAALDERAPDIAARLRLALQAHNPEARLAHCWALLDALTHPSTTIQRSHNHTRNDTYVLNVHPFRSRKASRFHVS